MKAAITDTGQGQVIDPQLQEQLMQLRDIDLPPLIDWWPLAMGWWILLAIIVASLCAASVYVYKRARSRRYQALAELAKIRESQSQLTLLELATKLSVLLHRFVIAQQQSNNSQSNNSQSNKNKLHSLGGEAWSDYLAGTSVGGHKAAMDPKVAVFLAMAPYCNGAELVTSQAESHITVPITGHITVPITKAQLLNSTGQWIRRY